MKIKVKKTVEVEEEIEIEDRGSFVVQAIDVDNVYPGSTVGHSMGIRDVEVTLDRGVLNKDQLDALVKLIGKKVALVPL